MTATEQVTQGVNRVVSTYKSPLTGHWIVDRSGGKGAPGSMQFREGFVKYESARAEAARIVNEAMARHNRSIEWLREHSD